MPSSRANMIWISSSLRGRLPTWVVRKRWCVAMCEQYFAAGAPNKHRRGPAKLARGMTLPLLPTTVVGSYPQPDWLVDRDMLTTHSPPRVRMRQMWRVDERFLEEAQDDATRLAILDMERAGLDIVSDG